GGGADGDRTADHRHHESEQHGPDPLARVPAEPAAPRFREPADDAASGSESLAAFEAVLLARPIGRSAARAEAAVAFLHRLTRPAVGAGTDARPFPRRRRVSAPGT